MLQLNVQTVTPISDRPLGAPGCQADCEVSGKTQKVFAQCLLGAPALSILCPQTFPCWLLSLAAGTSPCIYTGARQKGAGEGSQEVPRQPLHGRKSRSVSNSVAALLVPRSARMPHSELMNSLSVQMRRKAGSVSPDRETMSAIQEAA